MDPDGRTVPIGVDGVPRDPEGRPYLLNGNGHLIIGADGKPLLLDTYGKPVTSDGRPVLMDEFNRPILGSDGLPIVLDKLPISNNKVFKVRILINA